jgi:hypothetical protein
MREPSAGSLPCALANTERCGALLVAQRWSS